MEQTTEQLNQIIRSKYNALDEAGVVAISPAELASAVLNQIDPDSDSPDLVSVAAILELRQLSRWICRQRLIETEHAAEQSRLFDFQLQPRYPASRKASDGQLEDVYVLRSHLTLDERRRNIDRLRREGQAKILHADALQAETDSLIRMAEIATQDPCEKP